MAKIIHGVDAGYKGKIVKLISMEPKLTVRYCEINNTFLIMGFIFKDRFGNKRHRFGFKILTDEESVKYLSTINPLFNGERI